MPHHRPLEPLADRPAHPSGFLVVSARRQACLISLLLIVALMAAMPIAGLAQSATPVATPVASPASSSATERAAAWLMSQQARDGGFLGFAGESDPGATVDALLALTAARDSGVAVDPDALTDAYDYLDANGLSYAQTGGGQAAKLALAAIAVGGDPRDVGGVDPVSLAERSANPGTGVYGTGPFDHALVMLALIGAEADLPAAAIDALSASQSDDGGWSYDGATGAGAADSNTTAFVVQALVAAGEGDDPLVDDALSFLRLAQAEDGGFAYQPGDAIVADANSSALVVQAIIAVGEDPTSADWNNAAGALLTFQNASGAFRFQAEPPDDNLFATVQALPAIAGVAFPVGVAPVGTPAASPIAA